MAQVQVLIVVSNGQLFVVPDPVRISEGAQDEVVWRCADATLRAKVHFRGDSPFEDNTFHIPAGGGVITGPAVKGKHRKDAFKYDVEVYLPGQPPLRKDPEVVVDP